MNTSTNTDSFPWISELEKTVVHSLTTSFGLDFLLLQDKKGGNVDTIHNVRKGIHATETERDRYDNRADYNPAPYHKHPNYSGDKEKEIKGRGEIEGELQKSGNLHDPYRNKTMAINEGRDLDHIIAAKEVHNDAGRILAGLDGVELANKNTNLQSTHQTINRSKGEKPIEEYLNAVSTTIKNEGERIERMQLRLSKMPRDTPEQQHDARKIEDKIQKIQGKVETLKSIDPDGMREKDKEARESYESEVNQAYYASSKFLHSTAAASASAGLRMGTRQMLGLIAAEIWFELREQLPKILKSLKHRFTLDRFLTRINHVLKCIWKRIKTRFNDFITGFKDGAMAGIISSLTTTAFNVFATTSKNAIKIIREMWGSLVKAFKAFFFNPENLSSNDRNKAVLVALSTGAATVVGAIIYAELIPVLSFPFGSELAAFVGALATGLVTLGLTWLLLHSPLMKSLWDLMEHSAHVHSLRQLQTINQQLDDYLEEMACIEFGLDPVELEQFSAELASCNSEIECSFILRQEVERRGIELPFEAGNPGDTRKWLSTLAKMP